MNGTGNIQNTTSVNMAVRSKTSSSKKAGQDNFTEMLDQMTNSISSSSTKDTSKESVSDDYKTSDDKGSVEPEKAEKTTKDKTEEVKKEAPEADNMLAGEAVLPDQTVDIQTIMDLFGRGSDQELYALIQDVAKGSLDMADSSVENLGLMELVNEISNTEKGDSSNLQTGLLSSVSDSSMPLTSISEAPIKASMTDIASIQMQNSKEPQNLQTMEASASKLSTNLNAMQENESVQTVITSNEQMSNVNNSVTVNEANKADMPQQDMKIALKDEAESGLTKTDATENKTDASLLAEAAGKEALMKADAGETVHIKVAEPYQGANPEFAKTLADNIAKQAASGNVTEYNIQLEPQNLGKIMIRIAFSGDGAVVELSSSNLKTLSLLTENAKSIGNIVENHANAPVTVEIRTEEENPYWDQQQNGSRQQSDNQNNENQQQDRKLDQQEDNVIDFLQQMRLGLLDALT